MALFDFLSPLLVNSAIFEKSISAILCVNDQFLHIFSKNGTYRYFVAPFSLNMGYTPLCTLQWYML